MKVHSYGFILEAAKNTPLEAVEGKITKLYPRKSGTSAGGKDWSFQNGELVLDDGHTIPIKFSFCDEVDQSWRNKRVRICSKIGEKDGKRTGVYADDDDRSNPPTRIIRMTSTHQLFDLAQAGSVQGLSQAVNQQLANTPSAAPAQSHAPAPSNHSQPAQNAPTSHSGAKPDEFLSNVRKKIFRIAGLQSMCYDAAAHNAHRIYEHHGIAIMPGAVGVMGDKIFMEVIRRIDVDLLPIDPYKSCPFKGTPLDQLIPHMRQQIAEGKAEIEFGATEARHNLGAQAVAQAAATPPPIIEPEEEVDQVPF